MWAGNMDQESVQNRQEGRLRPRRKSHKLTRVSWGLEIAVPRV
jgi:hypothetical protein